MMGKHDDIMLGLTDKKLISLLKHKFGDGGLWSKFHWVLEKDIKDWNMREFSVLLNHVIKNVEEEKDFSLDFIKTRFLESRKLVESNLIEKSLEIKKTFEFPIIKGERQYKTTKGFLDLIVHCRPFNKWTFSCYKEKSHFIEFIIEIKKEEDFKDTGSILRQIKEYKEYYDCSSVNGWISGLENYEHDNISERIYCILSTRIPSNIKKFFEEENILCLELKKLKDTKGRKGDK